MDVEHNQIQTCAGCGGNSIQIAHVCYGWKCDSGGTTNVSFNASDGGVIREDIEWPNAYSDADAGFYVTLQCVGCGLSTNFDIERKGGAHWAPSWLRYSA